MTFLPAEHCTSNCVRCEVYVWKQVSAILRVCVLLTVSWSVHHEWWWTWIGKVVEGNNHGLFKALALPFSWSNWGELWQNFSVDNWSPGWGSWTGRLQNIIQKWVQCEVELREWSILSYNIIVITEQITSGGNGSHWYLIDAWFNLSWGANYPDWSTEWFSFTSKHVPGYCLSLGHSTLLPHALQHLTPCRLSYWRWCYVNNK
jgi:hypothetical protein